MKHQRLDYSRLAEVLHEQGIANVDAIRELLQHSQQGGLPFCEALVTTNLVTDWDLSRIVCETFHLPFLPVGMIEPNPEAQRDIDLGLFATHQLVPLDRFGHVLTVAMPGLVQADVLATISASTDLAILPVVGTVETNRRWVTENLQVSGSSEIEGGWSNLFDQADAEVQATIEGDGTDEMFGAPQPLTADDQAGLVEEDEIEAALPSVDAAGGGLDLGILGDLDDLGNLEAESIRDEDDDIVVADSMTEMSETPRPPASGGFELPPMPEFDGERKAS